MVMPKCGRLVMIENSVTSCPPCCVGVEVKGPAGTLRPAQSLFLERIRCAGGVAFMARDCRDVLGQEVAQWAS